MDHDSVEEQVLAMIMPGVSENESVNKVKKRVMNEVVTISEELGLKDITPILVGSVAKDTHLKNVDLDIFMMFPPETSRTELEKYGLEIGHRIMPDAMELYAEHPYLRGEIEGIKIDLVPCYNIKDSSSKLSAVDRTPFHTAYVKNNLGDALKRDVRLFKQFLKGIGAYGAEIAVQGFSGYLCEIMVMEAGGFHLVLELVGSWDLPSQTIIIPKPVRDNFDKATLAKFIEPLIFIDPVDVSRNVAAPVSEDIIKLVQTSAGEYLARPSDKFFFPSLPEPFSKNELKKWISEKNELFLGIEIITEPIIPDVLYSQVRKSLKAALILFERNDFSATRSNFYVDEHYKGKGDVRVLFLMILDTFELPEEQTHRGPPIAHPNSESFLAKWDSADNKLKGPYQDNDRWFVDIQREFTSAIDLLQAKFSTLNHGKQLNFAVAHGNFKIMAGSELAKDEYAQELTVFLLNKDPWEY